MGMSLNVIIQNLAQLKARYEKTWEVITGNCDSTIFLGGKEETTLKSISEQLGKETIDVKGQNRTKGKQSSTSENNSILGRELMQQNELATMPISDCIVMIRSKDIPAKLEDLAGEELEVQLRSVEIYSNNTEKSGDPDDLTGFSFDLMT